MPANGRTKEAKAAQADSRKRLQTYFKKVDTRKKNRLKARATGIKGGREGQEERIRNRAEITALERKRATTGGIKDDPSNTKGETKPKRVGTVRKGFARVPLAAFRLGGGGGGGAGRK